MSTDRADGRNSLTAAERLLIDTLAAVGGSGWLRDGPRNVYTLDVPADPDGEPSLSAPSGRVACHNVRGATLRSLHGRGLIEYPDGEHAQPVRLTEAGNGLAKPDRRRRELAGIATLGPAEVSPCRAEAGLS
jgi:hypothetical protein